MSLQPVAFQTFGGLDLHSDPEEIGAVGATDLLNVDQDRLGRIRTRDGLSLYDTSGATGVYDVIFADYSLSTPRLLMSRQQAGALAIDRISGSGTTITNIGSWGSGDPKLTAYANFGTPTANVVYMASHGFLVRKLTNVTLTTSNGSPAYIAVTPWDNRLCQGNYPAAGSAPTGANGSPSTVFFSDAGDADTFSANNYLHLRPGDGEDITGIATFGDVMIVAKETNLFVFTGVSTTGTGTPIFNYRRLSIPARINNAIKSTVPAYNGLVVGDDGVYFTTNRGLYVTTGGPPVLVSGAMSPIFDGTAATSLAWDGTSRMELYVAKERIFLVYTTVDGAARVMVYDVKRRLWTVWSFASAIGHIAGYASLSTGMEALFLANNTGHIYKFLPTQTTDYGTGFTSYWQSGIYELGPPGATAFTRWTRAWGSGAPTISVFTDHGSTDANAGVLTLGTSPVVDEGYHLKSYQGRLFQHRFSATTGAFSVSRVQQDVASVRP